MGAQIATCCKNAPYILKYPREEHHSFDESKKFPNDFRKIASVGGSSFNKTTAKSSKGNKDRSELKYRDLIHMNL